MLTYKGYLGQVEFLDEENIFYGEVINTRDVITFQGQSVAEIRQAFIDSIEDYLEFCAQRGEMPDKPFSGKFNLRIGEALHRDVYSAAKAQHKSLNEWIIDAIQSHLQQDTKYHLL